MSPEVTRLYDALISRGLDELPDLFREVLAGQSPEDLYVAIARFAVLAFSGSEQSTHSVMASRSLNDLRDESGGVRAAQLLECARYVASVRPAWSEPPIVQDPVSGGDPSPLDRAVLLDRTAADEWLSRVIRSSRTDLYLEAAARFSGSEGDGFTLAMTCRALVPLLGEKGTFLLLRLPLLIWRSAEEKQLASSERRLDAALLERLLRAHVAARGAIDSFHRIALFAAAVDAIEEVPQLEGALAAMVSEGLTESQLAEEPADAPIPESYSLARDFGALLELQAIRNRLSLLFPSVSFSAALSAAVYNLQEENFEDWTFA